MVTTGSSAHVLLLRHGSYHGPREQRIHLSGCPDFWGPLCGSNNAAKIIDEIEVAAGGAYTYVGFDALTWTKVSPLFSIGGTVNGLAAGSSVTLATGAQSVVVNASGAFTFPTQVATGTAYSVTVSGQSPTPPQFCSVTNGSGVVAGGNVTRIVVNCASNLQLHITDDDDYIGYGESRDYLVTLTNSSQANASNVQVAAALSEAFDLNATSWKCLSSGETGVTCNGAQTSGALADTASVTAGSSVQWLIQTAVKSTTTAGTANIAATASFAPPQTDSNALVIFRSGFEANGALGIELPSARGVAILDSEENYAFELTLAATTLVDTPINMETDLGVVRVQRLNANTAPWLRLQWISAGKTVSSDWSRATPNAPLTLGGIRVEGTPMILLEGEGTSTLLPLGSQE